MTGKFTLASLLASSATPQARNAVRIAAVLLATAALTDLYAFYLYAQLGLTVGAVAAGALLMFCVLAAASLFLSWRGRVVSGMSLLIGGMAALFPIASALIQDIGLLLGLTLMIEVAAVAGLTLPQRPARLALLAGGASGLLTLLVDLYWPAERLALPALYQQVILPLTVAGVVLGFGILVGRQFPRYRLNTKLLIGFLTVALVPLTIASVLNERAQRNSLTDTADQVLSVSAVQTAASLDAFINSNLDAVLEGAQTTLMRGYMRLVADRGFASVVLEAQLQQELADVGRLRLPNAGAAAEPVVSAYYILDLSGRVVLTNAPDPGPPFKFLDRDLFRIPYSAGRVYVSPIYFLAPGDSALFFSAPIFDNDGVRLLGVLTTQVSADWLQRLLAANNGMAGSGSFAALFDDNGLRIADGVQPDIIGRFAALPDDDRLSQLRVSDRVPSLPGQDLDSRLVRLAEALVRTRVVGATPVAYAGPVNGSAVTHLTVLAPLAAEPWSVMFAQPEREALAPARAQTQTTVLLFVAIALGVAGVSVIAARNLARPISRLTQVAARISEGELTARAEPEVDDEIGALANTFNLMTARLQQTLAELERRVEQRTGQLQAAADIGRATAGVRDLTELLELAIELVRGRFGFYHASIFLVDEAGEYAVLRESTGEVGAQLKARGHRLAIGSRSLVGWVTQNRKLRVARDVADDPFHFKNPLLPETRSELCIPLIVGDRLIGALDVQSQAVDAFSQSDQQAIQVLADQLSVAIENAQLFQRTQAALAEVRAQYQQTIAAAGRAALLAQPREMVFELEPGAAPSEAPVVIPLRLRQQTIGSIELHGRAAGTSLSAEEQAVLETIAAQLAAALESASLLQESQQRSRRDQLITEITDQMRATLNPASIVQTGIRQLSRALGATQAVVRIQPAREGDAPEAPGNGGNGGEAA
jgi:GAF domain-containing protein/HAMP domain-containing protein